jgi:hypothetical protein
MSAIDTIKASIQSEYQFVKKSFCDKDVKKIAQITLCALCALAAIGLCVYIGIHSLPALGFIAALGVVCLATVKAINFAKENLFTKPQEQGEAPPVAPENFYHRKIARSAGK